MNRHKPASPKRPGQKNSNAEGNGRIIRPAQKRGQDFDLQPAVPGANGMRQDPPNGNGALRHAMAANAQGRQSAPLQPRYPADAHVQGAVGVLTCTAGPEEGLGLTLCEGVYGIGRGRDNHFVLKDIAASRQHLEIRVQSGQVLVVDLGSGNGTRLNGKRVQQAVLKPGDRIEIGNSALTFTSLERSQVSRSEISVVPPKPSPKPSDLWPETETLLSELKASQRMPSRPPPIMREAISPQLSMPASRPPAAPPQVQGVQARPMGTAPAHENSMSMADIQASIGHAPKSNSTWWLLGGAAIILLVVTLFATIVYLTQFRSTPEDQARKWAASGSMNALNGQTALAKQAYEQALLLDPGNADAKKGLLSIDREADSDHAYKKAQQFLSEKKYEDALHSLEAVAEGTSHFASVETLRRRINSVEANDLLNQARTQIKKGKLDYAAQLIDKARLRDANNAALGILDEELKKLEQQQQEKANADAAAVQAAEQAKAKASEKKVVSKPKPRRNNDRRQNKPRRTQAKSMSDDEARKVFTDGVTAFKNGDRSRSRALMEQILRSASKQSNYYLKAQNFISTRL